MLFNLDMSLCCIQTKHCFNDLFSFFLNDKFWIGGVIALGEFVTHLMTVQSLP